MFTVLILVVMEDGLVQDISIAATYLDHWS